MTNIIDLDEERKKRNLSLPKEIPTLDEDWDDVDVPQGDRSLFWGVTDHYEKQRLLNRYLSDRAQSDPGDEDGA